MVSKEQIKNIGKLLLKKNRIIQKKFIAEGKRLIEEALTSKHTCEQIFFTEQFLQSDPELIAQIRNKNIGAFQISSKDFSKISSTKNSQGILGIFGIPEPISLNFNEELVIGLENISDPGNLGTILRSCEWFGVKTVVLSPECAEIYNPKVVRSSMGAIFKLKIIDNINIYETVKEFQKNKYDVYYTDMDGEDYRSIKFDKKTLVFFSNEAFGPSNELKEVCRNSITIPKHGTIDSLNVAAAAAVILSKIQQ